ncbi:Fic family protein [Deferribacterales bacterium RsTz2092]|nr:cell filamentation protein Fic [Deferribacterales bacterium]
MSLKSFIPHALPITSLDWEKLAIPIGRANASVSLYNGLLRSIPNPHILLSPMTTQEAVLSSRIEGTQASLSDVFKFEAGESYSQEEDRDIREIMNYRKTLFGAEELLEKTPVIHLNMLKELHTILLSGVRGANKARGEFRKVQNFIGAYGATIEQALYIPPSPDKVLPALDAWEKYINSEQQEVFIQLAVLHAQFEIIHPFLDGNGRLGRILIPLFLYQTGILTKPVFYLSQYFEEHRDTYYQKLRGITQNNDWQGWVLFFLNAVIEQANINTIKVEAILNLYKKTREQLVALTNSSYAIKTLDALFFKPIISSKEIMLKIEGTYKSTVLDILRKLETAGIITTIKKGSGRAASVYAFPELINLTEGREIHVNE